MPTETGTLVFYTVEELAVKRFGRQYQIEQSQLEKFLIGSEHGKD